MEDHSDLNDSSEDAHSAFKYVLSCYVPLFRSANSQALTLEYVGVECWQHH